MDGGDPLIDEECRRRFETHRRAGGRRPLETFLPEEGSAARSATLEELLLIELEFLFDAWDGSGAPPSADALLERHPELGAHAASRVRDEARSLETEAARRGAARRGVRFGRYTLKDRAGRGASADVWRAFDEELGRDVAVKLARAELAGDADVTARLVREARSTAQLRHPAIVSVHEVGARDGQPYIVSDFIEGPTLAQEMARRRFTADEAASVVARLADALDYAHACGVVHRDVKPANVLLQGGELPVLTDFGLARLAQAESALTRQGDVLGTPAYMAPEQARGDVGSVDARTDVYALGAVLYELLTGRPPFSGGSAASVLYAVVHEDPAPPRSIAPGLPADLATVCTKAMARERRGRYGSARELADDLRRFLARQPVAARPPGPARRFVLWARRNPSLAASAAVVVAVAAVAFARIVDERDRSRANLYRALLGEADARLSALDTNWFRRAQANLREAAALDVPGRDVLALRELAARCEGVARPSFEPVASFAAHRGAVRAVAAVPGTRLLAGIGAGGEVWLRSIDDGALAASRTLPGDELRALVVRADGAALLVAGDAGVARLLSVPGLLDLAVHDAGQEVRCAAFGASRSFLGLADGSVEALDAGGGRLTPAGSCRAHDGAVLAMTPSHDGARLATSGEDRAIVEWDAATLASLDRFTVDNAARALRYDDGGRIAWAAPEEFGFGLRPRGGAPSHRSGVHESAVRDVHFADAGRLVTASGDGTLRAWSGADCLAVADGGSGPVVAAAALGDGLFAAAHADGRLRVWRLAESGARHYFVGSHVAAFAPATRRLFTGNELFEYDRDSVRLARRWLAAVDARHPVQLWGAAISADGRVVASSGHEGAVKLLDVGSGELVADLLDGGEPAWALAFAPDGRVLAAGSGADVVLFDVGRRARRSRSTGHAKLVSGIAFHPREPLFVTVSLDRTVRVWSTHDGSSVATLASLESVPHGVGFSPDGTTLAVACDDGSLDVWTGGEDGFVAAREPTRRVPGHASAAWAVAFSPDGSLLASCDDRGRTILREARSFTPLVTLRADVRLGRSVSFGDGGRLLAVCCFNGPSVTWDLAALRRRLSELGVDWRTP